MPQQRLELSGSAWEPFNRQEMAETARREFLPTVARVSAKRAGRRERMLARLKEGPCRTWDLMLLGGAGFSSRLHELRREGHRISCEQDEDGAVYRLEEG